MECGCEGSGQARVVLSTSCIPQTVCIACSIYMAPHVGSDISGVYLGNYSSNKVLLSST